MKGIFLPFICLALFSGAAFAQESSSPSDTTTLTQNRSRGNSFNPDIGINGLFLYQNSNRGQTMSADPRNGFSIQEAELQFTADVDPYTRFAALFSLHPELDKTVLPYATEYVFEPEEIYAETISLPLLTLRAGKFRTAFGRHNQLHTHAFPFIDAPLAQSALLGEDGFNDLGFSASALLPLPWFSEVTVQALSGEAEGLDYFSSPTPSDLVALAHFKNLWDLSDELTLEFGLSGASGDNNNDRKTELAGADLTFKWRPVVFGTSRSVVWSSEVINREVAREDSAEKGLGYFTYLQYQFAKRWWVQFRHEYLQIKDSDASANPANLFSRKNSILVAFLPSEFSGVRLQYDHVNDDGADDEHKVSLQLNFSIGAHPAHAY